MMSCIRHFLWGISSNKPKSPITSAIDYKLLIFAFQKF